MAYSSLLDIIKRATDELGLPRPVAVAANVDPQVIQLFAAANAAGRDLMRSHDWSFLQQTGTITTANGTSLYALAADYDRMIPDTGWNRSTHWRMVGPDSPQANRELLESSLVQVGVNKRFRLLGSNVSIFPTPTAVETLVYEYVSNKWALSSTVTLQTEFLSDTDTSLFDPDLLKAQIKWRFMSSKGMYADGLKGEADGIRDLKISADLGGTILSMEPDRAPPFLSMNNVQDGNFS